jgi:hypothetical protein
LSRGEEKRDTTTEDTTTPSHRQVKKIERKYFFEKPLDKPKSKMYNNNVR